MINTMKKVCLITGCNSEIGVAIAEQFLLSHEVYLCWHNNCDRVQRLFQYNNAYQESADLTVENNVTNIIGTIYRKFGRLDLIVNCIGKNNPVPDDLITEEIWDEVISANLKPAFFLCQVLNRQRKDEKESCVINITSTAGINPIPRFPHYIAAKAGVIALSKYYSKLMAPYVRVNTIAPGFIDTEKHKNQHYDNLRDSIPLKRFASVEEIVNAVLFLYENKYITGQTIILDGGMTSK